jgi:tungstate transport system substrate-binding protein
VNSIFSGRRWLVAGLAWLTSAALWAQPVPPAIVLASTTSTEQSGLFAHLLPLFQRATGIAVKVVAVGSGQAIDMARRGDADVLLAHDRPAEERLVADGFALKRLPVMYNDFVLIGPAADPARTRGRDIVQALRQVRQQGGLFRAATAAAPIRPSCGSGNWRRSSRRPRAARVLIGPAAAAWGRR